MAFTMTVRYSFRRIIKDSTLNLYTFLQCEAIDAEIMLLS